ncbi:MFS domain-containing protein [Meloidogyne graminicola]|uniref:MFS domain-containing protein n=1 Tax=Meloidogyne graminicola TaxID=189291 RepID=A0A8S9ZMZ2_9BILA|nr:MFS domain-containing protein [Meloidogyne graminicola]
MDLINNFVLRYRQNRKMLLAIVYVAIFLDNMLLTTVVPIIPEYLLRIQHPNSTDLLLNDKIDDLPLTKEELQIYSEQRRSKRQYLSWDSPDWDDEEDVDKVNRKEGSRRKSKLKSSKPRNKNKGGINSMRAPFIEKPLQLDDNNDNDELSNFDEKEQNNQLDDNYYIQSNNKIKNFTKLKQYYRLQKKRLRHEALADENVHVGLMFGSKALIQLITNPLIGPLTNKIGYTVPMFGGFVILFLSTLLFAFGSSFSSLWLARALQGVGSACTSTSGMGMIAQAYPDDAERGSAMGIALGGLALGVLVGPPYGGLLYQWAGKELPFILLALLALFDGTVQFLLLQPKIDRGEPEGTAIFELIKDPYIIVAAGSITIGNLGIAILEPSLPLWMMESWSATSFERGAAFLPASISYMIGTNIFGPLAHKIGRWLSTFIGIVVIGFCLILIPSAESIYGLILPNFCMGFSIGMIDASMFPMMGYIVDIRHVGVYGSIYAIADAAFCFAFFLGPFFSGPLVQSVGFSTMMYFIAAINFCYAPLMFFLRNLSPPITTTIQQQQHFQQSTSSSEIEQKQILINTPLLYEKIEGINDAQLLFGYEQQQHQKRNGFNSVWDD